MNDQPTVADITVADDVICAGGSSTLTASSAITGARFTWYSDATLTNVISTNATLTVSPAATTTYYVRLTNVSDCFTAGKAVTVTVNDQPTVADITVADDVICAGGSSTLTASSAITGARFTWYSDATLTNVISTNATLTVSPAATTTYYVRLTNVSDCFTVGKAVTVTVNDQPTLADITVADDVICAGGSSTLTASSAITGARFTWYSDAALSNVISTNATLTVSPSTTTTYYVKLTNVSDCFTAGKAVTVTVNDQPTVADITVADDVICAGASSTLTASSAITGARFTWYSDAALTNVISTNATLTVSPSATTTYYVRLTNISDCFTAGKAVTVTVNDQPTLADITVADNVICAGASSTLTASSNITGARFTWYSDAALSNVISTNATLTVSPSTTTTYYVRLTNVSDCFTGGKAVTVTVNDQPTLADITVADDAICAGGSSTLTASSAITGARFTWYSDAALSNVISTNATLTVSPSTTTTYYVRLTNVSDCFTGGKGVTVTVNDQPTVTDITVADDAICAGGSATLTASSAITGARFTWYSDAALSNVISTNATLTVSPSTTTTYYVRLTNVSDCFTGGKAVTVTVNDQPTVADITVADDVICAGASSTLTASSTIADAKFMWYSDAALTNVISTNATLTVSPAATTTYYVRLTNVSDCFTAGKAVTVTVNDQPTLADITVADDVICAGGSSMLTASSAITGARFTWYSDEALSNVISNTATLAVSPSTTTTYYVRLTNASGCFTGGRAVTVTVNDQPTVADITVADDVICAGGNSTLTASSNITGAIFTWYSDAALSNVISTNATLNVSPSTTSTYYVKLANVSDCFTAGKAVTVTVNDQPTVADITVADDVICAGASSTLTASSTIADAKFTWYSDAALSNVISTNATLTVSPLTTTTYYVILTNASDCATPAKAVTVTVHALPAAANVSTTQNAFCTGGSSILISSVASGNQWFLNNVLIQGATSNTYEAKAAGVYSVRVTNANGCLSPVSNNITVTEVSYPSKPTITEGTQVVLCESQSVTLTSSAPTGNQWFKNGVLIPDATNQQYIATEAANYTVTTKNTTGCESEASAATELNINPAPKGFNDVINSLTCGQSSFSYHLQNDNINVISKGGNALPASFSWTVSSTMSGAENGSGDEINATLINTTNQPQQVIYTVTPRGINGGCQGAPFTITVTVPVCLDISIVKAADRSSIAEVGDRINYTITVTNNANASHHDVVVADPMLGGTLSRPRGDNGNRILERNETWTYTGSYVIKQADLDNNGLPLINSGKIVNVASVVSAEYTTPKSATAEVAIRTNPAITLVKSGMLKRDLKTIAYTFIITNAGNVTLKNLELQDAKLAPLTVSPAVIAPGASVVVTADYTITDEEKRTGNVRNTATATGYTNTGIMVSDVSGTDATNDTPTDLDILRYPTAIDDFARTKADVKVEVPVVNNDLPSLFPLDASTIDIIMQPLNGILEINPDGRVVYIPNKGFSGKDTFTYKIYDENGLPSNTATVTVTVAPPDLDIPNTFTPNGDGKNDTFQIKGRENYDTIELAIFNRWGDEVYRNKNYKDEWDGAGLNEGTYFYVIKLKKGSVEESRRSWILLKR
ncbi:T9SS C-terminal target domain-containing protein [Pedobacter sp. BAL39]|uniref:T9SS C-terminal target domain-containing protein n=1 Tax=Pedobacter sp. BAL39 TaxID=391596 RepID=UPI00031E80EA|nr:T9SS C-terminal target domain-containing protein [Pedobacter sp. BAL39]